MKPNIREIIEIAHGAGKILKEGFGKISSLELKGEIDVVTEVDNRSENYIISKISNKYSDHTIIAEESGEKTGVSISKWYIDPLDGTTNFTHNMPIFSVSIAYAENNEIIMGVVYDPINEETFSAEIGKGAKLNGEQIRVGDDSVLSKSLLVTGFPYDRMINDDNNLDNFNKFALKVRGIRRLGSAALDLCYVASNRVSGYWEIRLESWDLAAGMLIAKEAGAIVTKRDGSNDMLSKPISVIAANPILHKRMLTVLMG